MSAETIGYIFAVMFIPLAALLYSVAKIGIVLDQHVRVLRNVDESLKQMLALERREVARREGTIESEFIARQNEFFTIRETK